jgi:hypothetical protein
MTDLLLVTGGDAAAATRSLALLVEGVTHGFLRRAVILGRADDAHRELADAAGATLLSSLDQGVAPFGSSMILVVPAGVLLPTGWPALTEDALLRIAPPGAGMALSFRARDDGFVTRFLARPFRHGGLIAAADLPKLSIDRGAVRWLGTARALPYLIDRPIP